MKLRDGQIYSWREVQAVANAEAIQIIDDQPTEVPMKLSEDIALVRHVLAVAGGSDVRLAFDRILAPRCITPEISEALEELDFALSADTQNDAIDATNKLRALLEANHTAPTPHSANIPTIDAALAAAQSESESWKAIEAWITAGRDAHGDSDRECAICTPDVLLAIQLRAGSPDGDQYECHTAHGKDRTEALAKAAEWCRAELAK